MTKRPRRARFPDFPRYTSCGVAATGPGFRNLLRSSSGSGGRPGGGPAPVRPRGAAAAEVGLLWGVEKSMSSRGGVP
jgi:hypothetical protein